MLTVHGRVFSVPAFCRLALVGAELVEVVVGGVLVGRLLVQRRIGGIEFGGQLGLAPCAKASRLAISSKAALDTPRRSA
jgi:hypothetical protein